MKTFIAQAAVGGVILLMPAGLALAHGVEIESRTSIDSTVAPVSIQLGAGEHGGRGRDHAEDISARASASSTASTTHKGGYWSNADNNEDVRGRGADEGHRSATSTATTSRGIGEKDRDHGNARGNKLQNFLAWFLGQPDSTTVGQIKAEINASTTASSTQLGNGQGLGFFARLFGFLHHDN